MYSSFICLTLELAHENLHNIGVLHGGISENNILVDLSPRNDEFTTRRGLLIDLDMARFFDSVQVTTPVDAKSDQEDSFSLEDELRLEPSFSLGGDSNTEGRPDPEKRSKTLPKTTASRPIRLYRHLIKHLGHALIHVSGPTIKACPLMLARHGVFLLASSLCHSAILSGNRGHLQRSRLQPGKRG